MEHGYSKLEGTVVVGRSPHPIDHEGRVVGFYRKLHLGGMLRVWVHKSVRKYTSSKKKLIRKVPFDLQTLVLTIHKMQCH